MERNKRKTDLAWNYLYNRLEKDGLLPDEKNRRSGRLLIRRITINSAVAACSIFIILTVFNWANHSENNLLLTEQNEEKTTLVTTLEDGSIVYLAQNTSLHYPEHFAPEKREVILQGNALFDITGNHTRPFVIETEDVQIEVIGTAFNVKSDGSKPFELSVQRGEVKVSLKNSNLYKYVKVGETVALLSSNLEVHPTKDMEQFARYTEQIRFKDERLEDILHIINLTSPNLQLQASPELGKRMLTVSFSNNTPEDMAELICLALHLKYTKENNRLVLSE